MTAYQFTFYSFYQLFRLRSQEGGSAFKAGVVVGVMQVWIAFILLALVDLWYHTRYIPPAWVWTVFVLANALLVYSAFDRRDRWKDYANKFKHYPRTRLLVGRLLVAAVFTLSAVACFGLTWLITKTLPPMR